MANKNKPYSLNSRVTNRYTNGLHGSLGPGIQG